MYKCESLLCKHNQICSYTYGYCKKEYPKLETKQDPETYKEVETGRCLDFEKKTIGGL